MITRFAPSPTGPLHLGHAYSAMLAHDMARAAGGTFLLRIEDIDRHRSKPAWEAQIHDDLHWLGLSWPAPCLRQSDRAPAYDTALDTLWHAGLLYECICARRDIYQAASAPQEGARVGPDGVVYPGTCRPAPRRRRTGEARPRGALRLDLGQVMAQLGGATFVENGPKHAPRGQMTGAEVLRDIGDVVVQRRDFGTSYHLSVVVDDAFQRVTHVVRGEDLFEATFIHVILQGLLGLPCPTYHHHPLIRDDTGRRLAKRDDARAISLYRAEGATPQDIRRMVGLPDTA